MTPAMNRRLLAASAVALAVLAAVAWRVRVLSATPVDVIMVRVEEVVEEVRGPGVVDARIVASVGARITGLVSEVLVDVGDRIEAGALLARLEDSALRARLASTRSASAAASHALAAADAEAARTGASLELARRTAARQRSLAHQGITAEAFADEADTALAAAAAGDDAARAGRLAKRAELERAREELTVAEIEVSYARILAPFSGLVTARRTNPGETVLPGATMVELLDSKSVWVAAQIDGSLIGRIAVGQPARLRLRSGWVGVGTVARLSRRADPVARELEVDISFAPDLERLTLDEEAEVAIEVGRVISLAVPVSALAGTGSERGVFVVRGGRAIFVAVRVGARGAERVVIEAGLDADELVVRDPRRLVSGARVRVTAAEP